MRLAKACQRRWEVFITAGTLKRGNVLIKAVALTDAKLIIVGDGRSYDDNLNLIEELGLDKKVVLLRNISQINLDTHAKNDLYRDN